ncbi:exostosin family protein [Actinidia rufa]|uniref:Exostosin family protein n=1 Tax=Actinidia rufa TaxID=165716 RepID=A0A7J0FV77_9ERIC|nr:exostosin family protein [Actinidia rufa]
MQPAMIPSNVDRRDGVSPGGWRQNLDCSIGLMNRFGSCSQTPFEQSMNSHDFEYPPLVSLEFALFLHSSRILRRMLGEDDDPPPPAKTMSVLRRDLRTRVTQASNKAVFGNDRGPDDFPNLGRIVVLEKLEQIEAVFETGVDVAAVEVAEGVDPGVVGEEDGGSDSGIGGETWVLKHAAVEDQLEHKRFGSVPASGLIMGFLTQPVVGQVGAEIVEETEIGAVCEEVDVESGREVPDVIHLPETRVEIGLLEIDAAEGGVELGGAFEDGSSVCLLERARGVTVEGEN